PHRRTAACPGGRRPPVFWTWTSSSLRSGGRGKRPPKGGFPGPVGCCPAHHDRPAPGKHTASRAPGPAMATPAGPAPPDRQPVTGRSLDGHWTVTEQSADDHSTISHLDVL